MIFSKNNKMSDESNTNIKLYAGWKANEYSIIYDYSDVGEDDKVYYNGERFIGNGALQSRNYGTTKATQINNASSGNITTVTFDSFTSTRYLQLERTGYIFNGWSLNSPGDYQYGSRPEDSAPIDNANALLSGDGRTYKNIYDALLQTSYTGKTPTTAFVLNRSYAAYPETKDGHDTSCYTTSSYLYYFNNASGTTNTHFTTAEQLGDNEVIEGSTHEHVIVLYANWTARTYEINFNYNNYQTYDEDLAKGKDYDISSYVDSSTIANYTQIDIGGIKYSIDDIAIRIVFDTADWYGVNKSDGSIIKHNILPYITAKYETGGDVKDRTGYTFIGWYTSNNMYVVNNGANISSLINRAEGLPVEYIDRFVSITEKEEINSGIKEAYFDNENFNIYGLSNLLDDYLTEEAKLGVTGDITLYAGWDQIVYTADVHLRDTNTDVGSTHAYMTAIDDAFIDEYFISYKYGYEAGGTNIYTGRVGHGTYRIKVKFDSEIYLVYEYDSGSYSKRIEEYDLYAIMADRYGYTWTGWYLDEDATSTPIVTGHTKKHIPEKFLRTNNAK